MSLITPNLTVGYMKSSAKNMKLLKASKHVYHIYSKIKAILNLTKNIRASTFLSSIFAPPRWPSGLGVRLGSGRSGVRTPLATGFSGSSHTSDLKNMALKWLPCQAPGFIGSALGLVGPVSVYCDWVR